MAREILLVRGGKKNCDVTPETDRAKRPEGGLDGVGAFFNDERDNSSDNRCIDVLAKPSKP